MPNAIKKLYDLFITIDDEKIFERLKLFTVRYVKQSDELLAIYKAIAISFNKSLQVVLQSLPGTRAGKVLNYLASDYIIFFSNNETDTTKKEILRDRTGIHSRRGTIPQLTTEFARIAGASPTIQIKDRGKTGWIVGRTQPAMRTDDEEISYTFAGIVNLIVINGTKPNSNYSSADIEKITKRHLVPAHVAVKINLG